MSMRIENAILDKKWVLKGYKERCMIPLTIVLQNTVSKRKKRKEKGKNEGEREEKCLSQKKAGLVAGRSAEGQEEN